MGETFRYNRYLLDLFFYKKLPTFISLPSLSPVRQSTNILSLAHATARRLYQRWASTSVGPHPCGGARPPRVWFSSACSASTHAAHRPRPSATVPSHLYDGNLLRASFPSLLDAGRRGRVPHLIPTPTDVSRVFCVPPLRHQQTCVVGTTSPPQP